MRRKGELTPAQIDREWPHQVAVPSIDSSGVPLAGDVRRFTARMSICSRGHTVNDGKRQYHVFCFSDPDDAAIFRKAFGGEDFDPRERGRGANWMKWYRGKQEK